MRLGNYSQKWFVESSLRARRRTRPEVLGKASSVLWLPPGNLLVIIGRGKFKGMCASVAGVYWVKNAIFRGIFKTLDVVSGEVFTEIENLYQKDVAAGFSLRQYRREACAT